MALSEYSGTYSKKIDEISKEIEDREPFNYNFNADPLYQQYKNAYTQNGQLAMKDTVGKVSALTGGYGNSYAQTAGQQQYNNYMQQANSSISTLKDSAYSQYQNELNNLEADLNRYQALDESEYSRYKNAYDTAQTEKQNEISTLLSLGDYDALDKMGYNTSYLRKQAAASSSSGSSGSSGSTSKSSSSSSSSSSGKTATAAMKEEAMNALMNDGDEGLYNWQLKYDGYNFDDDFYNSIQSMAEYELKKKTKTASEINSGNNNNFFYWTK